MKKVLSVALFFAILILMAFTGLALFDSYFKYGRMWETPAVRPHEEEILAMETGTIPLSGGEAIFRATPSVELAFPFPQNDPDIIALGKTLYFTYCAQCHGKYHDGNGTVGQSFSPLPRDLRSRRVQSLPEGSLFKEISYGIPNGRQPPLATTIDVLDRWRIIAHIKSLGIRK